MRVKYLTAVFSPPKQLALVPTMLRKNEHELSQSYAARTSGYYSRYETPQELLKPTEIATHALANIEALVMRGYSYDDIADLVESRVNHPNAVAALGFALMLHRMTNGTPFRKARKMRPTCSVVHAIVDRLAVRCDIIWKKLA